MQMCCMQQELKKIHSRHDHLKPHGFKTEKKVAVVTTEGCFIQDMSLCGLQKEIQLFIGCVNNRQKQRMLTKHC